MKKRKRINNTTVTQQIIILLLIVLLVFASATVGTFALFTRYERRNLNVLFGNPVVVNITGENFFKNQTETIDDLTVYPGSTVPVKVGIQVGNAEAASSPAFVRCKLTTETSVAIEDNSNLIIFKTTPNPFNWVIANFGTEENPELWYVLIELDGSNCLGKSVTNGYTQTFINGTIELNGPAITNDFGNQIISLVYTVSAVQSVNVPNPIVGTTYEGLNPYTGNTETIYWATWPL